MELQASTDLLLHLSETEQLAQMSLALESLVNRPGVPLEIFLRKLSLHDAAITTIVAGKLARVKNPDTVVPLMEAYRHFQAPRDAEPMLAIIAALDSIAQPQSREFLEEQLAHPFPAVRRAAQHALQKLTGETPAIPLPRNIELTRYDFPQLPADVVPKISVETTRGKFEMILFPDKAPVTVANFVNLVSQGFYNGIYFHRVIPGFVVQAGDPRGDGWGGPGYTIPCEYNDLFYDRGTVGMAHAGKDTGGSQFFITQLPQPHLNGRHTAFGKIVSGWDVIDRIEIYDQIIKTEILN